MDSAFKVDNVVVGVLIRDEEGGFVVAIVINLQEITEAAHAEVLAISKEF